jgi:hypothetical protein
VLPAGRTPGAPDQEKVQALLQPYEKVTRKQQGPGGGPLWAALLFSLDPYRAVKPRLTHWPHLPTLVLMIRSFQYKGLAKLWTRATRKR